MVSKSVSNKSTGRLRARINATIIHNVSMEQTGRFVPLSGAPAASESTSLKMMHVSISRLILSGCVNQLRRIHVSHMFIYSHLY